MNILYYSIVDIVDSAIINSDVSLKLGQHFSFILKNDLYKLSRLEKDSIVDLFYNYKYPNIKKERITDFITDLTGVFEEYESTEEFHYGLTSLKQILRESIKKGTLPFLMDEKDYILLEDFSQFYLRPLYSFRNSEHIFDNEDTIEKTLEDYELLDNGEPFKNYQFKDSKDDILIQLSDILVGIVGKFFHFLNTNSIRQIENQILNYNELQKENLCSYLKLIERSSDKNIGYIHNTISISEKEKLEYLKNINRYCANIG